MNKWSDILEDLQLALDTSFCNKECLIPAVQIGLVASLTTLLQLPNQERVNSKSNFDSLNSFLITFIINIIIQFSALLWFFDTPSLGL